MFLPTIFSPPLPAIFVYWFLMRQVDTIIQYMPDFVPSSIHVIHYQIIDFLDSLTERCLTVYDCIVAHCFANASENWTHSDTALATSIDLPLQIPCFSYYCATPSVNYLCSWKLRCQVGVSIQTICSNWLLDASNCNNPSYCPALIDVIGRLSQHSSTDAVSNLNRTQALLRPRVKLYHQ